MQYGGMYGQYLLRICQSVVCSHLQQNDSLCQRMGLSSVCLTKRCGLHLYLYDDARSLRPKAVSLQCESLKPRRETPPPLCTYSRVSGLVLGLFLSTRIRDNHCVSNVICFSLTRDLNTLSFIRTDEMRILVSPKEQFKPEHKINQKEFQPWYPQMPLISR